MRNRMAMTAALAALAFGAWADISKQGVPSGCDPSVMSEAYWSVWNDADGKQRSKLVELE